MAGSLLERARHGDADALDDLLRSYDPVLVAMARLLVAPGDVERVVLHTWQGVLGGAPDANALAPGDAPVGERLASRLVHECGAEGTGKQPDFGASFGFLDADEDDPAVEHRWKGAFAKDVQDWGELGVVLDGSGATRKILADGIALLPLLARQALLLRDVAGVPLDQMAVVVGLSRSDALQYLRWARAQVQLVLEHHLEPVEVDDGVS